MYRKNQDEDAHLKEKLDNNNYFLVSNICIEIVFSINTVNLKTDTWGISRILKYSFSVVYWKTKVVLRVYWFRYFDEMQLKIYNVVHFLTREKRK